MHRLRFQLRQIVHDLSAGLFFRPALIVLGLAALAIVGSAFVQQQSGLSFLFPGEPGAAQLVLTTIASSMMTVVAVVYSILLVALSLASMQFSPRVLRLFVQDRVSQLTLGLFVGTFVYCLLVLRVVQSAPEPVVPVGGVVVAVVLAVLAMGQLVYFIHHITHAIQANHLIDQLAGEAEAVIDATFVEAPQTAELPDGYDTLPRWPIRSTRSGYIQLVDTAGLSALAASARGVVTVVVPMGQFVTRGLAVLELHAVDAPDAEQAALLEGCLDVGPIRTMQDDAEWGLRQIVDIALKAISPAVNDPSTAVTCIDHLGRVLVRAFSRWPPPAERGVGEDGRARVILRGTTHVALLDLAVLQIRQYAKGDMAVSLRLLRMLETVCQATRAPEVLARVERHAVAIAAAAQSSFSEEDCEQLGVRLAHVRALLRPPG